MPKIRGGRVVESLGRIVLDDEREEGLAGVVMLVVVE